MTATAPIVEMRKISKLYRGVPAVKEVDFDLRKGEIHALLGENGAGKSTLTKVMAGVVYGERRHHDLARQGSLLPDAVRGVGARHCHGVPGGPAWCRR